MVKSVESKELKSKDIKRAAKEVADQAGAVYSKKSRKVKEKLKKDKISENIFIAFVLNLAFSIFEFIGGSISGSVSIMSDAIHDLGDAISIGLSFFLERKSHKGPDTKYTYGYSRFSVLGGFVTTLVLMIGSSLMIYESIMRLLVPQSIDVGWMIILSVIGLVINSIAAFRTRSGKPNVVESINQRSVNLHMLEDVFGWLVVLSGAIVIRFTSWTWLDATMSVCIAVYFMAAGFKNFRNILSIFLEKVPDGASVDIVKYQVLAIPHVKNVHHIHIWSMDEKSLYATMHIVVDSAVIDGVVTEGSVQSPHRIKDEIRKQLKTTGIDHVTIELESEAEKCKDR